MPDTVLSTKLYIPPPRPDLVPRPRLTERLQAGARGKLTLVSAPAGYGKSTLVSEWIERSKVPAAWLSLDESDNDLSRFFIYLIAALQGINPDIGAEILPTLESGTDPPIENLLTTLVNDITASAPRFTLVLDDYHTIQEIKVHQALDFLFDHFPPGMHMVIVSRTIPPMPLGRLRVQQELTEIRVTDLRFNLDESAAFLNSVMGLALSNQDIQNLETRTEGWIAGLQLAALTLRSHPDKHDLIADFSGSHHHLIDYLVHEVLSQQSENVQVFLLCTSILERFNTSLCNALTQQISGREMLIFLEKANLFLISTDNERKWFRYHHLFADFLRQRLREEQPEIIPKLFTRASQWYEAQGMLDEAIEHALAGNDVMRAARLIDENAETLILVNAEISQFVSWANRLPLEVRAQFPRLCIFHAVALQFEYQLETAESTLTLAEAHLADLPKLPENLNVSYLTSLVKITRAYIAGHRGNYEEALDLSLLAYKELADSETRQVDILRGTLALNLGMLYNMLGQVENAYHFLQIALPLNQRAGLRYPTLACLEYQMNTDFACGALHRASATGEKGLHWIGEWSQVEGRERRPARMLAQLRVEMGKLHYEWNNLGQAARYWRKSREYFELVGSWHRVSTYIHLVDVHQASGNVEKALGYLHKVKRMRLPKGFSLPATPLEAQIVTRSLLLNQSRPRLTDLFAEAVEWAQTSGLKPEDEFRYEQEYEYLTLARVLTAQKKAKQAVPLLDRLITSADSAGRNGQLITYLSLQAVSQHTLKDTDTALTTLARALALGKPQSYIRTFVDLGSPMQDLLKIAGRKGIAFNYVSRILDSFPDCETISTPAPASQPGRAGIDELIEPLNEREMTILRYMAARLSNQEIANELHLSVNTVKWYARNIFSKLGVGNRRAAVVKARELGIL